MTAERWRSLVSRLLNGNGGSTVSWRRRTLTSNGPAGTSTETASTTHQVRVAQLTEHQRSLFGDQSWQTATVRLVCGAAQLPFTAETHSGEPEVRFDDVVTWLGV